MKNIHQENKAGREINLKDIPESYELEICLRCAVENVR